VLLLHRWGAPEHASLRDPDLAPAGHGVVLWIQVDDLDAAWMRAERLGARIIDRPRANVDAGHREFTVADPDGYVVAVCAPVAAAPATSTKR
jgi:predicted enzyme related to lactoylglutathione lyase